MTEPSQNTMSGSNPMNSTFKDPTAFQYSSGGTRSDQSESIGSGTKALLDTPVDLGRKEAVGDPKPSMVAQGDDRTITIRVEESKTLPGAEGPVVKGNKSAVEDLKQEVGYVEGQLGSVATQTRNY
ncbi:hypothetical protein EVJ58_g4478 [Rhodofomes roseus]|uniref:Uncharacterized protein n=1 Tax=Rhodofomes roseus TaxID=34475 RepID=A0A4Y9YGN1_9APHY|nr:hypothetical protein EVJ58_g4478 [Rhodofomes roseus]